MNRTFLTVAVALACLIAAPHAPAAINVGDRPKINLRTLEGQPLTSEAMRGRLVILEFWATWCGPCIKQLPHLKQIHAGYKDKGVALVSVSIDDSAAVAKRFIKDNGMVWTQIHSPQLADRFGVRAIPNAFVLSPNGEVVWNDHPARLTDQVLNELIQKHPPRRNADEETPAADADAALRTIKAARSAADAGEYATALQRLAEVPGEAITHPKVVGPARVLTLKLSSPAVAAELDAARAADPAGAAKLDTAIAALASAAQAAAGAEGTGGRSPQVITAKLKQARTAEAKGDHVLAYKAYTWLIERAGDTPAGITAAERLVAIEADKAVMSTIRAATAEDDARELMALAHGYESSGKRDLAKAEYQKVLDQYGTTKAAELAKARLAAMK